MEDKIETKSVKHNESEIKTDDKLQSKVISFLRFPLIVGVLFIHNYSSTIAMPGTTLGNDSHLPFFHVFSTLFSQILGRVFVPMFFFMSGFLFFFNIGHFDGQSYLKKIKSRIKTLLVPYLFWNVFLLMLLFVILYTPALNSFLNKKPELNLNYLIKSLWSGNSGYPISYQFWFIRDLMVVVLLTPILYLLVKYLKLFIVLFLCCVWYLDWWISVPGFSIAAVFFFTAGAWFSINNRNLIEDMRKYHLISIVLYPLIVFMDLWTNGNSFVHNAGILIGIVFWFNISAYLLDTGKVKVNGFLMSSSFFVFAFHEPLLTVLKKVIFKMFKPESDLLLTIFYFGIVLLVVFVTLIFYFLLQRLAPKFLGIITGR